MFALQSTPAAMMGASVAPWPSSTMMDRVSLDDLPHKGNKQPVNTLENMHQQSIGVRFLSFCIACFLVCRHCLLPIMLNYNFVQSCILQTWQMNRNEQIFCMSSNLYWNWKFGLFVNECYFSVTFCSMSVTNFIQYPCSAPNLYQCI